MHVFMRNFLSRALLLGGGSGPKEEEEDSEEEMGGDGQKGGKGSGKKAWGAAQEGGGSGSEGSEGERQGSKGAAAQTVTARKGGKDKGSHGLEMEGSHGQGEWRPASGDGIECALMFNSWGRAGNLLMIGKTLSLPLPEKTTNARGQQVLASILANTPPHTCTSLLNRPLLTPAHHCSPFPQVTFVPGLEGLKNKIEEKRKSREAKQAETVWEAYLRRKKEKAKMRKVGGLNSSLGEIMQLLLLLLLCNTPHAVES
eukprot:1152440-Pelagomonas_calceolata.AAC.10